MANTILEPEDLPAFLRLLKDAGDKLVVVDFTATWCGPCRMIAPKFKAQVLRPENQNVVFMKVDVDEADDVSKHCKIESMPTFQFYIKGKKVDEFSGANEDMLIEKLEALRT
ncbi:thioredoxin b [Lycodopsis pacificus]